MTIQIETQNTLHNKFFSIVYEITEVYEIKYTVYTWNLFNTSIVIFIQTFYTLYRIKSITVKGWSKSKTLKIVQETKYVED